jgi:ATP-dependent helicase/nuclease subunit A
MSIPLSPAQREAVAHGGSSLLVSASAGSGKTRVLVERCLALVCGADPRCALDSLLVVTFTRAAAGELRARLAEGLRAAAQRAAPGPQRRRLLRQQGLLDSADIGTIDAWCGRVVREHFWQADVDPAFRVLSETEDVLLREQTLDSLLEWIYLAEDDLARDARRWLERNPRPDDGFLRRMIALLNDYRQHVTSPDDWMERQLVATRGEPAELRRRAAEIVAQSVVAECALQAEQLDALSGRVPRGAAARLGEYRDALATWPASLEAPDALASVLAQIGAFKLTVRGLREPDKEWVEEVRARWLARLQRISGCELAAALLDRAPAAAELVHLALRLEHAYQERLSEAKRVRSALSFADVQHAALKLLGVPDGRGGWEPTALARVLQRRYEHVLVDEFQDVSPVQGALLDLVSRRAPERSNAFLVGDVKQCIYAFRQAEPRLFLDHLRAFEADPECGRVQRLTENYRTHADLLAVLNVIFHGLFDERLGGAAFTPAERLTACREELSNPALDGRARIALHVLEASRSQRAEEADEDDPTQLLSQQVEREAALAAESIRAMVAGGVMIHQMVDGRATLAPLRYGDVVILLRSAKVKAGQVAAVLRAAGVPAVAAGRERVLDTVEVRDLRDVLALLVNRRRDVELAAYLRGPLGGLNEVDLLAIRRSRPEGAFWAAVEAGAVADSGLRGRVAEALDRIDCWRVAARELDVGALLRQVVRESGLELFAAALPGGKQRVAMLRAFLSLAGEFARRDGGDPGAFVEHLDALDRQQVAAAATVGEDVVRVMTIHAAKGLEFPVVYLLHAGAAFSTGVQWTPLRCDEALGVGIRFHDYELGEELRSAAFHVAERRAAQRDLDEELRLLYVAVTRARDRLIVVGHSSPGRWEQLRTRYGAGGAGPELMARLTAPSALEWLLMSVAAAGLYAPSAGPARVEVDVRSSNDVDVPRPAAGAAAPVAPSEAEPIDWSQADESWLAEAVRLLQPLDLVRARQPAVVSVSALRLQAAGETHQDRDRRHAPAGLAGPGWADGAAGDAREVGVAVHAFLQHADLASLHAESKLRGECERLVAAGLLTPRQAESLPMPDLAWFGGSDEGRWLAAHAAACRREVPFVYALPFDGSEQVMVRGVIDCLVEAEQGLVLLDYKTDRVYPSHPRRIPDSLFALPDVEDELRARIEAYRLQIYVYGSAARALFARPVWQLMLVFLRARRIEHVPPTDTVLESLMVPAWRRDATARKGLSAI